MSPVGIFRVQQVEGKGPAWPDRGRGILAPYTPAAGNPSVSLRLPPLFHKGGFFVFPTPQRETARSSRQPLPQLGPGSMTLVGGRGNAPQVSPRPSGKLFVRPANHFRSWVQGTTLAATGSRVSPWPQLGPGHGPGAGAKPRMVPRPGGQPFPGAAEISSSRIWPVWASM